MVRRAAWFVTATKIRPTKIEIVANREFSIESLGMNRTRNATSMQRVSTRILERKALKKSLFKVTAKEKESGRSEKPKKEYDWLVLTK